MSPNQGYDQRELIRGLERVARLMRDEEELLFKRNAVEVYALARTKCD